MGGILQVDTIQNNNATTLITQTNSTTLTFGVSGQNIIIPSGVTFNTASATINYPAGSITDAAINASAAIATTKLGAGAVLQVVTSNLSSEFSTASASDQDTGLLATITPTSSSNKILILLSTVLRAQVSPSNNCYVTQKLWRGAIGSGTLLLDGYAIIGSQNTDHRGTGNFTYLDSPATTSATTYRVSIAAGLAQAVYINQTTDPSTITLIEIKG